MMYALGKVVLTGASMADMFSMDIQKIIAVVGLLLTAIGTGGIKPCVFTFGGEQFQLPQQEVQLQRFTSKFVISIYLGALISTFLMPELRQNVHCFGKDTCYPLVFGVSAVLMLISIVVFVFGKNKYIMKKPEQSVISRSFGCVYYALRNKMNTSTPCNTNWLDNTKGEYTDTEISETRAALNVITMFTAYPVFWAMYEQQGSRWTLQAVLMNGHLDFLNWTIKPDQMYVLVPFLGIIFIFLFDVLFYPLLAMVGIRKTFQKLTLSGILAIVAFVFAAMLQLKIYGHTTVIPPGEGHIHFYNGFDCNVIAVYSSSVTIHTDRISPLEIVTVSLNPVSKESIVPIVLKFDQNCSNVTDNFELNTTVVFVEEKSVSYYLTRSNPSTALLNRIGNYDDLIKDKYGNPKLRLLIDNTFGFYDNITLNSANGNSLNSYSISKFRGSNFKIIRRGKYNLIYNGQILSIPMDLIPATFYTLTLQRNGGKMDVKLFSMDEGNYLHLVWQLPQFICMVLADAIFIVTTMEFSLIEAPKSMKSFVMSASLMTTAIGNLLVVVISTLSIKNQAYEYLLYSGLMIANTLLFSYFSVFHKSINVNDNTPRKEDMKEEMYVFEECDNYL